MSQSAAGGRTLPDNANIDIGGGSQDMAAIITALRDISTKVQSTAPLIYSGTGAPSAVAPSTGGIYIRVNGDSTNTLMVNPGGSTWSAIAQ